MNTPTTQNNDRCGALQPVYDSVILDMDGTLWDAVDSYSAVWNDAIRSLGIKMDPVTRRQLMCEMGKPLDVLFDDVIGTRADRREFTEALGDSEARLMPRLGGRLYEGVADGMKRMSDRGVKLMIVSNCSARGLDDFLDFTGLRPYVTDYLSWGMNGLQKDGNIRLLVSRHGLKRPLYVGDTQGDCDSAHRAGADMMYVDYGFGHSSDPDYRAGSFDEVADFVEAHSCPPPVRS